MQKFYWKGISSDDRIKAISEIATIVDKYGTILNFQKFSDITLGLVIEIECEKVLSLYKCLSDIMLLEGFDNQDSTVKEESILFLNVTFIQSTGDMEIEIPNIPK